MAAVAGMPPKKRSDDVGHPLTEELTVGVVPFVDTHRVGDRCRQKALERRQCGHRQGGRSRLCSPATSTAGSAGAGNPRQCPNRVDVEVAQLNADSRRRNGQQGNGESGPEAPPRQHGRDYPGGQQGRCPARTLAPGLEVPERGRDGLAAAVWNAERVRHLLQGDDDGNPQGEALDDREGDIAHRPAGSGQSKPDQNKSGEHAYDEDARRPGSGHDRDQHHGHRPGRTTDLKVAAAERGCQHPRHDRSDQPSTRSEPRRDPERQSKRQGHDGHGDPSDQVPTGLATHGGDVGRRREQPSRRHPCLHQGCLGRSAVPVGEGGHLRPCGAAA